MTRAKLFHAELRWPAGRAGASLPFTGLVAAMPLPAAAQPANAATAGVSSIVLAALLLALLGLAIGAALLAWGLRTRRALHEREMALQRERAEAHALHGLLDVWHWRTDAQHRVVHCRPPRTEAVAPACGGPAWNCFVPADGQVEALRARFEQQAVIDSVPVLMSAQPGEAPRPLSLQAAPLLDAEGRFAGHVGTARPRVPSPSAASSELAMAMPMPAVQLTISAPGRAPHEVTRNAASDVWFRDAGNAVAGEPLTWQGLLARMPAALRPVAEHAAAHPATGTLGAVGPWTVQTQVLPRPADGSAAVDLVMLFHSEPGAQATETAEPAADDAESFSYTVSHDLRAPIRVVEGFARIVKEDYGHALDRIGNDHLDRVLAAASRMNSMIDSLLALSQLSSRPLARQPVNLSLLAGYIIDDLRRQSPEREVEVHIEPDLYAHGDATLLRVVLENLLGNAWKYTGKCRVGRIWFEASEHEGRPAMTVRDNGAGFDMRFADRLFGVFQRLHSANDFQGTGVGLASVRRIVRRHGGDIWAEAEVDRGARFQFWI